MSKYIYESFDDVLNSKGDQVVAKEELINCLNAMRTDWKDYRRQNYESQWQTNLAFYSGDHQYRMRKAKSGYYRVYSKENHLQPIVNKTVSLILQNTPACKVMPMSTKPSDVEMSTASDSYIKYFHQSKKVEMLFQDLIKNACIFGNGYMELKYREEEMLNGIDSSPYIKGDIDITCEDPFKVLLRPKTDSQSQIDIIKMTSISKYFIKKKYGTKDLEDLQVYLPQSQEVQADKANCLVHEYYHLPTPYCPTGMYIVWTGKEILEIHEYPYHHQTLPIYHLKYNSIPTKVYGMGQLDDLIEQQEQLNRGVSMIIEARNIVANPVYLIPESAGIPSETISTAPGLILKYKGDSKPTPVVHSFNFLEMNASNEVLRQALNTLSGTGGTGQGGIPANITTAQAYQLYLEQSRSSSLPFIKAYQNLNLSMNEGILNMFKSHMDENSEVLVRIKDDTDPIPFSKKLVPNNIEIRLENVNALFWTEAGKKEEVLKIIEMGIIKDPQKISEMLQLNITTPAFEIQDVNRKTAQKEIDQMNIGIPQVIGPADMHAVHLDEHDKIIANYNFRSLPQKVQAVHMAHRQQHIDAMTPQATMPPQEGGMPMAGSVGNPEGMTKQLDNAPTGALPF